MRYLQNDPYHWIAIFGISWAPCTKFEPSILFKRPITDCEIKFRSVIHHELWENDERSFDHWVYWTTGRRQPCYNHRSINLGVNFFFVWNHSFFVPQSQNKSIIINNSPKTTTCSYITFWTLVDLEVLARKVYTIKLIILLVWAPFAWSKPFNFSRGPTTTMGVQAQVLILMNFENFAKN